MLAIKFFMKALFSMQISVLTALVADVFCMKLLYLKIHYLFEIYKDVLQLT